MLYNRCILPMAVFGVFIQILSFSSARFSARQGWHQNGQFLCLLLNVTVLQSLGILNISSRGNYSPAHFFFGCPLCRPISYTILLEHCLLVSSRIRSPARSRA